MVKQEILAKPALPQKLNAPGRADRCGALYDVEVEIVGPPARETGARKKRKVVTGWVYPRPGTEHVDQIADVPNLVTLIPKR